MDKRPELNKKISTKDFQDFYWLKKELVQFCRNEGLKTTGGKVMIAERIKEYLKSGKKEVTNPKPRKIIKSKFDWHKEKLTLETKITDNYKNSQNVRRFFKKHIGIGFKFNVQFMSWMKSNSGKTLKQATENWIRIKTEMETNIQPKEIAPQFEYNTYLRDFLSDNPNKKREVGIQLWKIKKSNRGDNVYRKEDLNLIPTK